MKPMTVISLVPLLATTMFFCGCKSGTEQVGNTGKGQPYYYVFTDRSDPILEYVFVLKDGEMFAQVANFPGYEDRTYYQMRELPAELQRQIAKWIERKADVTPPLVPSGPNFSVTQVPLTRSGIAETRYFKSDNQDIKAFLRDLRADVVIERHKVSEPPEWVMRDQRIRMHLGL